MKDCIFCNKSSQGSIWNYYGEMGIVEKKTGNLVLMKDIGMYGVCKGHFIILLHTDGVTPILVTYGTEN